MNISVRLVVAVAAALVSVLPAEAQDLSALYPTGCAPLEPGAAPSDAPRIIGVQDPVPRTLYGPRDLLIIDTGTAGNVQVGRRFYVRRHFVARYREGGERPIITSGGVHIIAANENMAIAQVDLGCDGMHPGDYLEPSPVSVPIDGRIAESDLDFSSPVRVLYGDHGRVNGGKGDVMLAELGSGAAPGLRYAIYRDLKVEGVPLAPLGEAVVVSVEQSTSLVRLTQTRDSITTGDLLIPHRR